MSVRRAVAPGGCRQTVPAVAPVDGAHDRLAPLPRTARVHTFGGVRAPITHPGDCMPLVAAALVVSTLLHAGLLSLESALTHAGPSPAAPSSVTETVRVVFEPNR